LEYKELKIIQNKEWFCFGIDSIILTNFAKKEKENSKILDLGTGTGIIPILLSKKIKNSKITAIEIQEQVAEMAQRSIKLNNLEEQIKIINCDIKEIEKIIGKNNFDIVITNPPYKTQNTGIVNENNVKMISRHEITASLEDFIKTASEQLKDKGTFYMINRPERLADIVEYLRKYKLEPKEIKFVQPNINKAPNQVLVKAVKNGGRFLKIEKPIYIYDLEGNYTNEILEIYGKLENEKNDETPFSIKGNLYLVATPIGNLEDVTLRAIRILKEVDVIVAEDTRHTLKLLNHLGIAKPMISYQRHSGEKRIADIINKLLEGKNIALVTDAGTPGISDPGEEIVKKAIENDIKIIPVPGACAMICALISSGLDTTQFTFIGFLPMNKKNRKEKLNEIKFSKNTTIIYEAPHKLKETLDDLEIILNNRKIVLAHEMTKLHETFENGTVTEIKKKIGVPKGEYVIVIEKNNDILSDGEELNKLTLDEHYKYYEKLGYNKKEIIKQIAKDRNVNKNEIYQYFIYN
jgi:16S rRNA (cytidine(1402)-2'-O)-methyltransferase